jgi:hypothetical protein
VPEWGVWPDSTGIIYNRINNAQRGLFGTPWGSWRDATCLGCALAHGLPGGAGSSGLAGLSPEAAGGALRIYQKKCMLISQAVGAVGAVGAD